MSEWRGGDVTSLTEFQGSHFGKLSGGAQLVEDVIVEERLKRTRFSIALADALTWKTTLDSSRRYVLMLAPMMSPFLPKPISMKLPKRLLLSFRVVLAFPIDCGQAHY